MSRDAVLGGTTLAFSAAYYWLAASLPASRLADAIGPQGLPKVYAVCLAALSLALIGGAVARPTRSAPLSLPPAALRAGGMLLMGVAYVALVPWLGYLVAISALIFATVYYQGGSVGVRAAIVAAGGGVFFWLLFVVLMGIAQPPGFFPPQL